MNNEFNQALTVLYSNDAENNPFPIEFDAAYQMVGYSRKDNALRALISASYNVEGEDYLLTTEEKLVDNGSDVFNSISVDKYSLSIQCFLDFALKAKTEKGREVRKYYIQAEKHYRKMLKQRSDLANIIGKTSGKIHQFAKNGGNFQRLYSHILGVAPKNIKPTLLKMGWAEGCSIYIYLILIGYDVDAALKTLPPSPVHSLTI